MCECMPQHICRGQSTTFGVSPCLHLEKMFFSCSSANTRVAARELLRILLSLPPVVPQQHQVPMFVLLHHLYTGSGCQSLGLHDCTASAFTYCVELLLLLAYRP